MNNFVHLHIHSEFSILDGVGKVFEIVKKAKDLNMKGIAITDHGNVNAHLQLEEACKKYEMKPIFGCEFYIVEKLEKSRNRNHILVLAKNKKGMKNLLRLSNLGHIEGFYYRPRITWENLLKYRKGLIVLSGCMQGEIAKHLLKGNFGEAVFTALRFKQNFGKDFYLEMIFLEMSEAIKLNYELVKLSKATKISLVITCDSHYIEKEDSKLQDILLLIQQKKTFRDLKIDKKIFRFDTKELWIKTEKEIKEAAKKFNPKISNSIIKKAIKRTLKIEKKIKYIEFDKSEKFPKLELKISPDKSLFLKLKKGLKRLEFKKETHPEYYKRIKYEYNLVKEKGMATYFLIIEDVIKWAKKEGILVGDARGSVAGSLLCYILGITNVDPIKWGLLFERFYPEGRVGPPDIDTDFEHLHRKRINEYIKQKYKRVVEIGSYGIMQVRMVLKDVGRVYGLCFEEINYLTNQLTDEMVELTSKEILEKYPIIKEYSEKSKIWKEAIKFALKLKGHIRHISEHPAGIVVSGVPILSSIPLNLHRGRVITGWTEGAYRKEISEMGFFKYDLLGLRTLTEVKRTLQLIEKNFGKKIDFYSMEFNDPLIIKEFSRGNTVGVFQFESRVAREVLQRVKPTKFEHIVAASSLNRPGPLGRQLDIEYAQRKNNPRTREKIHFIIDKILKETYGTLLFQEQFMQIASQIGNFSSKQNDMLRKALVDKTDTFYKSTKTGRHNVRDELKRTFIKNAKQKMKRKKAEKIWELMGDFFKYGFNKSHACSYTMLSYKTMFFKHYYPKEFFAGILEYTDYLDKMRWYLDDAKKQGLKILSVDINKSRIKFKTIKNGIRYPFTKLKGMGIKKAELIVENQPFKSFQNFLERMTEKGKLGKGIIEILVKSGAFDCFGKREKIFNQLENFKSKEKIPLKMWTTYDYINNEKQVYGFKFPSNY